MRFVFIILTLILLLLTGCVDNSDLEKVSVRLPIPHYDASFTAFMTAADQGFYEEEGLDVTFNLGSSETNPARMVAAGADEFGNLGGPDSLLVARSRDLPLVAVSVFHKDSNFPGLVALNDSGIESVYDLEGKKIGFFYGHISTDVIHSLLSKYGINYTEVDVGSDYNQLIAGKVDAQWVFRTTGVLNLESKGFDVNLISPKDYGITTHGYTIFVTEDFLEKRPDLVRKFLRATYKGILYAVRNPDEGIDALLSEKTQNCAFISTDKMRHLVKNGLAKKGDSDWKFQLDFGVENACFLAKRFVEKGFNVIIEDIICVPERLALFHELLSSEEVQYIALMPERSVLLKRDLERGDWSMGERAGYLYDKMVDFLEGLDLFDIFDNTHDTPERTAWSIFDKVNF